MNKIVGLLIFLLSFVVSFEAYAIDISITNKSSQSWYANITHCKCIDRGVNSVSLPVGGATHKLSAYLKRNTISCATNPSEFLVNFYLLKNGEKMLMGNVKFFQRKAGRHFKTGAIYPSRASNYISASGKNKFTIIKNYP